MHKLDWRAGLFAGLLILLTGQPLHAADTVYKWVGEDGTTHYGTRPPNGVKSTAIKPKTGHSEPVDYSHLSSEDENDQMPEGEADASEEASTKDPARCEAARKNKEILGRGGRVREPTDDGSFRYLSEEEKAKRLEDAQKAIDEAC